MYQLSIEGSVIAGFVVILDQITKMAAVFYLNDLEPLPLICGILNFTLVRNTGAAFGLFKGNASLFVLISVVAIMAISFHLLKKNTVFYFPLSLILGGAIGNLIDRLRLGYVIDFIDFQVWPVFNVADSCITIGAATLFFLIIKGKNASRTI
ncbi:MAG: signal peptidase II [Candidatus Omnitrophota bacterium]